VDVAAAIQQGRYVSLDVIETLSTFMVNDLPDTARCLKVAGDLVMEAAKAAQREPPRVAVCGECAPILWAQGEGGCGNSCRTPLGRDRPEARSGYFVWVCVEQLSA